MHLDAARAVIETQFPELRPARVTHLGEGYDSTAFEVNGHFVFRFPKRPDVERQLFVETAILPILGEGSPVPVPRFSFHGLPSPLFPRHFGGYAKLSGLPAINLEPGRVQLPQLAAELGRFLSFLHAVPVNLAAGLGVPEYPSELLVREAGAEALSDLHRARQAAPDAPEQEWRALLEKGTEQGGPALVPATLVHGDLAAEHILVDPSLPQITGVIDWSEIAVGDPAIDFAGMWHWGGIDLMNAVLSHYELTTDEGLPARARFLAACRGVGDVVFGLDRRRPEYVAAGLRALRLCLGE